MQEKNLFEKESKRMVLVTDWEKYFSYPKIGTLRNLIFKNRDGFADEVSLKIGGRRLINVDAFFKWVEKTNGIQFEVVGEDDAND